MDGKRHWAFAKPAVAAVLAGPIVDQLLGGATKLLWATAVVLFWVALSGMDPDADNKEDNAAQHRSIITHSGLVPTGLGLSLWFFSDFHPIAKAAWAAAGLWYALHLIADVPTTKRLGKYCLDLSPFSKRRLGGDASALWYALNGFGLLAVVGALVWQLGGHATAVILLAAVGGSLAWLPRLLRQMTAQRPAA